MSNEITSWDALAAALNTPVREIYRIRKLPGAPEGKDLEAWQEYFQTQTSLDLDGLTPTSYDDRLRKGKLDLDAALVHSRLVEQEIINERRREELKRVRGDTVPKDKVEEKIRAVTRTLLDVLAELPEMVAAATEPGKRPEARKQAKDWVDALRTIAAERLRLG